MGARPMPCNGLRAIVDSSRTTRPEVAMISQLTYTAAQMQRQEQLERSLRAFELRIPRRRRAGKKRLAAVVAIAAAAVCTVAGVARAGVIGQYTLATPTGTTWTAPAGADLAQISAAGGQGGAFINADGSRVEGGRGASASGWLALTPGESLNLWAGG